jgi:hypothetical protein
LTIGPNQTGLSPQIDHAARARRRARRAPPTSYRA